MYWALDCYAKIYTSCKLLDNCAGHFCYSVGHILVIVRRLQITLPPKALLRASCTKANEKQTLKNIFDCVDLPHFPPLLRLIITMLN